MRVFIFPLLLCLALLLETGCRTLPPLQVPSQAPRAEWVVVMTAPDPLLAQWILVEAARLEQALTPLTGPAREGLPPSRIYAYADAAALRAAWPEAPWLEDDSGHFEHEGGICRVVLSGRQGEDLRRLRHELVHAWMWRTVGVSDEVPFWLQEGMATAYEAGTGPEGRPRVPEQRERLARQLVKFDEVDPRRLMQQTAGEGYRPGDYALAWSLVSLMLANRTETGFNREWLRQALALVRQGQPQAVLASAEREVKALGGWDAWEDTWRRHLLRPGGWLAE